MSDKIVKVRRWVVDFETEGQCHHAGIPQYSVLEGDPDKPDEACVVAFPEGGRFGKRGIGRLKSGLRRYMVLSEGEHDPEGPPTAVEDFQMSVWAADSDVAEMCFARIAVPGWYDVYYRPNIVRVGRVWIGEGRPEVTAWRPGEGAEDIPGA